MGKQILSETAHFTFVFTVTANGSGGITAKQGNSSKERISCPHEMENILFLLIKQGT